MPWVKIKAIKQNKTKQYMQYTDVAQHGKRAQCHMQAIKAGINLCIVVI